MLLGTNTDLFNQLIPKARNSECQNLPFPLQIKPLAKSRLKLKFANFYFLHPRH